MKSAPAKAILDEYSNTRFYVAAGYEILALNIKDTNNLHFKENYRLLTTPLDKAKLKKALTVLNSTANAYQRKFPSMSRDSILKTPTFALSTLRR